MDAHRPIERDPGESGDQSALGSFPDLQTNAPDHLGAHSGLNPLRVDEFIFTHSSDESSIQIGWKDPGVGGNIRVFRQVSQLILDPEQPGSDAVAFSEVAHTSPQGWTLIGVHEFAAPYYRDEDIPSVNMSLPRSARRSLGQMYSYKIDVAGGSREARSPVIHTRIRGINRPANEAPEAISDSELLVTWTNRSSLAAGLEIVYYEDGSGIEQTVIINGTDTSRFVVGGLAPDTEYWVGVRAYDYYGKSTIVRRSGRTKPSSDALPEEKTFTVSLTRGDTYLGCIPYQGRFPTLGQFPTGKLTKVSLVSGWPAVSFVKPGKSTADCADPDASIVLAPGGSLKPEEMTELFGAATPDLPILFIATLQATPQLLNWIPIVITYRTD